MGRGRWREVAGKTGRGIWAARTSPGCESSRVKVKPAANAAASEEVSNLSPSPHPGPPPEFRAALQRSGTSPDPLLSRKVPLGVLGCWGSSPRPRRCVREALVMGGSQGARWGLHGFFPGGCRPSLRRAQRPPTAHTGRAAWGGLCQAPDATKSLKVPIPRNADLPWHPLNSNSPLTCSSRERGGWRCPRLEMAFSLALINPAVAVVTATQAYRCPSLSPLGSQKTFTSPCFCALQWAL